MQGIFSELGNGGCSLITFLSSSWLSTTRGAWGTYISGGPQDEVVASLGSGKCTLQSCLYLALRPGPLAFIQGLSFPYFWEF